MKAEKFARILRKILAEPKSIRLYARACRERVYRRFLAGKLIYTNGKNNTKATVIYAPGQTEPVYSPFNAGIARHLASLGYRTIRFDFKRTKDKTSMMLDDSSIEAFCSQIIALASAESRRAGAPIILMGKSFGGAIASKVADRIPALGCIAIGYPFFNPASKWSRTQHLSSIQKRLIIIQGTADDHGTPLQVKELELSPLIEIRWIQNADHGFKCSLLREKDIDKYNELLQACGDACKSILEAQNMTFSQHAQQQSLASGIF